MATTQFLQPSIDPLGDIKKITYEGQDPLRRMYKSGYEEYLGSMPVLRQDDAMLKAKIDISKKMMQTLHEELSTAQWVYNDFIPVPRTFNRTILALEQPVKDGDTYTPGSELVVTRWGDGFVAPPHGHSSGFMYEQVLSGLFRDTKYRVVDEANGIVRPMRTKVYTSGDVMAGEYYALPDGLSVPNSAIVHGFKVFGFSTCLHYVNSHPADGRKYLYYPEYFEDTFTFQNEDLKRIASKEGMYLRPGSVVLVRSMNTPEYEDHYIIVTGKPIMKRHGLRPQEFSIEAPKAKQVLDSYEPVHGVILLQLQEEARKAFLNFHNIAI